MPSARRLRWVSWRSGNAVAGLLIFGLLAAASVPAWVGTAARYGVGSAVTATGPVVLSMWLPVLVWIGYLRGLRWCAAGVAVVVGVVAVSPLWFWVGPTVLVVCSELARVAVARARRGARR